jgi:hypothetical protein
LVAFCYPGRGRPFYCHQLYILHSHIHIYVHRLIYIYGCINPTRFYEWQTLFKRVRRPPPIGGIMASLEAKIINLIIKYIQNNICIYGCINPTWFYEWQTSLRVRRPPPLGGIMASLEARIINLIIRYIPINIYIYGCINPTWFYKRANLCKGPKAPTYRWYYGFPGKQNNKSYN